MEWTESVALGFSVQGHLLSMESTASAIRLLLVSEVAAEAHRRLADLVLAGVVLDVRPDLQRRVAQVALGSVPCSYHHQ